eukprot:RCo035033
MSVVSPDSKRRKMADGHVAEGALRDPSLAEHDPELHAIMKKEYHRQVSGLEMIASENFTSRAVMECLGSCLTNKYSEGEAGHRYYGGNEFIDQVEFLAQKRALQAFGLSEEEWAVNVQPYSGSPANLAVYMGLLNPHDRIMGLHLASGGHLTHGYYTPSKKITASSVFFESLPYHVKADGYVDHDELDTLSMSYRPKLIICGASAYPRELDFPRYRKAADSCGALLMADIAHISGLVAAGVHPSPFPFCDIVTTTTHKSLRGPRSGIIFMKKKKADGTSTGFVEKINAAVFPGLQGGPHEHQIAAIATQFKEVCSPEFRVYAQQVKKNSQALAEALISKGYKLETGGSDNHLLLWDMRPNNLTGGKMEKILEFVSISVNKNTVAGDKSALNPSGIRVGTPALTTRGLKEKDMVQIAEFLHRSVQIATEIQASTGKGLKEFQAALPTSKAAGTLRGEVEAFASKFPMPGLPL